MAVFPTRRTATLERSMTAPTATVEEPTLLEVRELVTQFPTRNGWLTAVNHVSYTLGAGKVLGILGESGSGKSAMLRTILGLQPKSGAHLRRGGAQRPRPDRDVPAPSANRSAAPGSRWSSRTR
jgi:ABC-type dipeptide/oligopeptide/nickel transport system ATPase component